MEYSDMHKHNFEEAKNKIKRFSENLPSNITFEKVDENGGFLWLFDHNVTGEELNRFMEKVQAQFINFKNNQVSIIREFSEIYKTFDYLDKEYLAGILISLKKAENAVEKANIAQEDIKKTIEALGKTVAVLKNFKDNVTGELEKLKIIGPAQIEAVQEVSTHIGELKELLSKLKHLEIFTQELQQLYLNIKDISIKLNIDVTALMQYKKTLDSYLHLGDVDTMWMDVEQSKKTIKTICTQLSDFSDEVRGNINGIKSSIIDIQEQQQIKNKELYGKIEDVSTKLNIDVTALMQYKKTLDSYLHLSDVDTMWTDVEQSKKTIKTICTQLSDLSNEVRGNINGIKSSIIDIQEQQQIKNKELYGKIKIAYYIAGGASFLIIGQLLLLLLNIL